LKSKSKSFRRISIEEWDARMKKRPDLVGGLQDYLTMTFDDIVRVLGKPNQGDGYKVSTQWVFVEAATGMIVTVYDYKETRSYSPDLPESIRVADRRTRWHVGGANRPVVLRFLGRFFGEGAS